MPSPNRLVILGVGNLLCTDDGLGPRAVERLAQDYVAPEGVSILDGGTLGLSLLPLIEDADEVLLIDAVRLDAPAGTFVRLEGDDVLPAVRLRLSVHQVGVADLLDAARIRGRLPRTLRLLGLVPASIGLGYELSPEIQAAFPALLRAVVAEANNLGYELALRASPLVSCSA